MTNIYKPENIPRPTWPIKLDHISNDAEEKGLTGTGVMTQRHLRGHHSAMSGKIKHATTIIEFSPGGNPCRTDSSFLQRIMHPACRVFRQLTSPINSKDDIFGLFCCYCDNCHAQLFWDTEHKSLLSKDFLTEHYINDKRKLSLNLDVLYNVSQECMFKVNERDDRLYLEYDCPLLGFRELLFPIVFQDKVLAVFFVGELTLKSRKDFVESMIGSIETRIRRIKNSSPERFNHIQIPKNTQLSESLLKAHEGYVINPPGESSKIILDSPDKDDYSKIISSVLEELRDFETNVLVDAEEHVQHQYIRKHVSSSMEDFAQSTRLPVVKEQKLHRCVVDESPLENFWVAFESKLNSLLESFELCYALAFGPGKIVGNIAPEETLGVQAKTSGWEEFFNNNYLEPEEAIRKLRFRISRGQYDIDSDVDKAISSLKEDDIYIVCSPNDMENQNDKYNCLLEGSEYASLGDYQLILLTVSGQLSNWLVILLGYSNNKNGSFISTLKEHQSGSYFHQNALKGFFTTAALSISSIRMAGLEELRKKQLLYLGHESGQLTAGLDWLQETYKNADKLEKKLRDEVDSKRKNTLSFVQDGLKKKIENLCMDMRGYSGLMYFVFDMAERLGDPDSLPTPKPSRFRPFGDVLAKWKDSYRYEAERSTMQIQVTHPDSKWKYGFKSPANDDWRPPMWADQFLFEMIVYNLVNNAEKYGHRGTKIAMDCKLESLGEGASHILTVTSYGVPIDPEDRDVFKPFTRGKDTGNRTKGLGLGLYIVLNIVERIHGGEVKAICNKEEPFSKFNIPLIQPYIDRELKDKNGKPIQKDKILLKELKEELERLKTDRTDEGSSLFDSSVALGEEGEQIYDPEDFTILDEIKKPTYKVTLNVELPPFKNLKGKVKQ